MYHYFRGTIGELPGVLAGDQRVRARVCGPALSVAELLASTGCELVEVLDALPGRC